MSKENRPSWLPEKGIVIRRNWYKLRTYLGKENGKSKYGPEVSVAQVGCTQEEFFLAYNQLVGITESFTLGWMLKKYHKTEEFLKRAPKTKQDYWLYYGFWMQLETKTKTGEKVQAANIPLKDLKTPFFKHFLSAEKAKTAANRKVEYLSSAWSVVMQYEEDLPKNPIRDQLRFNEEKPRDRYVEDWEFELVKEVAKSVRNPYFHAAMELAYLCRARRGEVFALTSRDLKESGLYLARSKGSNSEITAYSDRLNNVLAECQRLNADAPTPIEGRYLLHKNDGQPYQKNGLDTAWKRIIKKAMKVGAELPEDLLKQAKQAGAVCDGQRVLLKELFTFHDIKAKGITDHTDVNAGQHKSRNAQAVYQRKPKVFNPTK